MGDDIEMEYNKLIQLLLKNVIEPNPTMLEKKLLVFPKCSGRHWYCVFVFNAGSIVHMKEEERASSMLQPCFFRYCSSEPNGKRDHDSLDVIWFLNFLYSIKQHHQLATLGSDGMLWFDPFKSGSKHSLKGTERFPSVRVVEGFSLPQQNDLYNCGFGLIAAIAIIMQNVTKSKHNDYSPFRESFSAKGTNLQFCEHENETYIKFPKEMLERLSQTNDVELLKQEDYLSVLRKEWFTLIDRLAAFNHQATIKQQMLYGKVQHDAPFFRVKRALGFPVDNDREEDVSPGEHNIKEKGRAAAESLLNMSTATLVSQSQQGAVNLNLLFEFEEQKSRSENQQQSQTIPSIANEPDTFNLFDSDSDVSSTKKARLLSVGPITKPKPPMLTPTISSTPSAGRKRTLESGGRKIPTVLANQKPNSFFGFQSCVLNTKRKKKSAQKHCAKQILVKC
ncbi:hypothetical protein MHU86_17732 [Fragilaria crotonensis]|nr:hypothetical protein MHU86_17732 [Fragilaria crotonensis]